MRGGEFLGRRTGSHRELSFVVHEHTLSKGVDFSNLDRAQKILGHKDPWAKQLSDFDRGARQKTIEPTSLREFLDFAADAGLSWTALEKANWTPWSTS